MSRCPLQRLYSQLMLSLCLRKDELVNCANSLSSTQRELTLLSGYNSSAVGSDSKEQLLAQNKLLPCLINVQNIRTIKK